MNQVSPWRTGLAFRPFFWLGAVFVIIALLVWWSFWRGNIALQPEGGLVWWHQHEMLFGFVIAIVTGFLLTAVQNWTGLPSVKGVPLWLLVLLWLVARLLLAAPMGASAGVLMAIDLAFLPVVAAVMASLVIRAKRWRNLVFIPVLLLLTVANAGLHWGKITANAALVQHSSHFAIWLIISLIVVIAGRVVPFFTSRALNITIQPMGKRQEQWLIGSVLFFSLLHLLRMAEVEAPTVLFVLPLLVMVGVSVQRLRHWQMKRCWRQPLLWSLHLSYAFIVLGAVLWLVAEVSRLDVDYAVHTLTIGGMLAIILSMMARVSLGHTGRPIKAITGLSVALSCVFIAALLRGVLLIAWPTHALLAYQSSLFLCAVAFLWFVVNYTIPLWTARVDQRPG